MKKWNVPELTIYLILFFIVVFYFIIDNYKHVYKKSSIDNRYYRVKNDDKAQESADTLAKINKRIMKLIEYIKTLEEKPEYVSRLYYYNPDTIKENVWNIDTTYTLNKGQEITFCLTPRDEKHGNEVYPINLLMYVAIHELAHVVSIASGHGDEFKRNFNDLLKHANDSGVYKHINFKKTPKEYCGIYIDT